MVVPMPRSPPGGPVDRREARAGRAPVTSLAPGRRPPCHPGYHVDSVPAWAREARGLAGEPLSRATRRHGVGTEMLQIWHDALMEMFDFLE